MTDLVSKRRLKVKSSESTVGRKLLERIEDDVGFRDRSAPIVKDSRGRGRTFGVLREEEYIFRGLCDRYQADAVAVRSRRTRAHLVGRDLADIHVSDAGPAFDASLDRTGNIAVMFDVRTFP
jgi:hypothetical protein